MTKRLASLLVLLALTIVAAGYWYWQFVVHAEYLAPLIITSPSH